MKAIIYLKHNPTPVEIDVEKIVTDTNQNDGNFTSIRWTTSDGWKRKLHEVILHEIAAIVVEEA